ncbi:hypothetical protein INS49_010044 [Diaporthe citri]|uniref:uncharacterized protein n=1 Tax=Diaporthe citri TaxID=83186 RepID=UPI001C80436B|nr:uncharacterized protein INS49_010044 [Diaporthe citri]KAG6361815.1 hypothetical protein INS49_010044 [Diaporthe citri]
MEHPHIEVEDGQSGGGMQVQRVTAVIFLAEPAKPSNLATFNHSFDQLDLSTSLTQNPDQSELTIDTMPITNKIKLRTATATVDDDPGGGDGVGYRIRIIAFHENCNGIVDLEQNEVDENTLCAETQDRTFIIDSLADLTYGVLSGMVGRIIGRSGDHGEAQNAFANIILVYVYDDGGIEPERLDGGDDQQLRDIMGRGSGFVDMVWDWANGDHN